MATSKEWADFLKKLGLKNTKKHIIEHIESNQLSNDEIWDYFIESNELMKETACANRFYKASDVDWYFREVSYVKMRGTFPSRSHGRSLIIPRLITAEDIKAQKAASITNAKRPPIPSAVCGKRIIHRFFGPGVITDRNSNGTINAAFDAAEQKKLDYHLCVSNGLIEFI